MAAVAGTVKAAVEAVTPAPTAATPAAESTSAEASPVNTSAEAANVNTGNEDTFSSEEDEYAGDHLEADDVDDDGDSAYSNGYSASDTTSLSSKIVAGYIENGRKYQTTREDGYWGPCDEKQFETWNSCHIMFCVLDQKEPNMYFRSPIGHGAQNILDIGTGNGAWCLDVADIYPNTMIRGVDLYPSQQGMVPPNCTFEVDDALKTWMYRQKFDLIHIRLMVGAFSESQWIGVYKQCYENIAPGGWIEQFDCEMGFFCDDGNLPADSLLVGYGQMFNDAFEKAGKDYSIKHTMRARMEKQGFINIHEKDYKLPFGNWPRNPIMKEIGRLNSIQFKAGVEGYVLVLLTKYGAPTPWSVPEIQVYLAMLRRELDKGYHVYWKYKRVWAQKPYDNQPAIEPAQPTLETVA